MELLDQTFEILELILLAPVLHVWLHHPNDTRKLVILEYNLGENGKMKVGDHTTTEIGIFTSRYPVNGKSFLSGCPSNP